MVKATNDESGYSVAMNNSGTRIAIGAKRNNNYKGHVRVYQLDDSADPESEPEVNQNKNLNLNQKLNAEVIPSAIHLNGLVGWFDSDSFSQSNNKWSNKIITQPLTDATTTGSITKELIHLVTMVLINHLII